MLADILMSSTRPARNPRKDLFAISDVPAMEVSVLGAIK